MKIGRTDILPGQAHACDDLLRTAGELDRLDAIEALAKGRRDGGRGETEGLAFRRQRHDQLGAIVGEVILDATDDGIAGECGLDFLGGGLERRLVPARQRYIDVVATGARAIATQGQRFEQRMRLDLVAPVTDELVGRIRTQVGVDQLDVVAAEKVRILGVSAAQTPPRGATDLGECDFDGRLAVLFLVALADNLQGAVEFGHYGARVDA